MLELKHVYKRYQYQKVLDDVSLALPECGMIGIVGQSGCGKSTLLHILGGIDDDFQGEMLFHGKNVKRQITRYRKFHVSFIFQQFHLIMWLSVKQNMQLSYFFHPFSSFQNRLDIQAFQNLHMKSLSLGQRQRIAYLRAIMKKSNVLLCDEPTGSLDSDNAEELMKLLKEESKQRLVVIVSHDFKLVKAYCDEIYEMSDGRILNHYVFHSLSLPLKEKTSVKKMFCPYIRLSLSSLLSHKNRAMQLVFGITISLICIILTLTLSRGLENQMTQYIYSLVPASGISFQSTRHVSLTQDVTTQFEQLDCIDKGMLYLDDYECLGVGFQGNRYEESETLFVGDDTSPYDHLTLKIGRKPALPQEIMVSYSTAQHLCKGEDINLLIDKTLYAWYKHEIEVKAIAYHVVGITSQTTTLDTVYQQSNSYIHLLKDVYLFDETQVSSNLGILYVNKDYQREDVIKQLEKGYPDYKYLAIGASTTQNISKTMQKVRFVLYIFSTLAILSSLFLVSEVMFLNTIQKKKDLAVMKCYGASTFGLLKIVFYESIEVLLLAQICATLVYGQLLKIANLFVEDMIMIQGLVFRFDLNLIVIVYMASLGLVTISQIPALIYILRLNTIDALK